LKMRKKEMIFAILILVLILISSANSAPEIESKVNEEVYSALEDSKEVAVIIKVDSQEDMDDVIEDLEKEDDEVREYKDLISVEVSEKELKELKENPDVEEVSYSHQIRAFLQDSVPLINASVVWPVQVLGINITGIDETVCVIDTGINFSHPDLTGKNKTCVIDCFNKACVENCSIADDNGHGTHVAGIISASGGIYGVGANISLIGLKVLDSNGGGSATSGVDLTNAIDWCVENRVVYNISVISMSLGTNVLYDEVCDSSVSIWATAINNATLYNISVISATGNNGSSTHISAPACIANSTSVGATDKDDLIASYSNRNSLTNFFAPGTNINSTMVLNPGGDILSTCGTGKSYCVISGTSMAAPHVAGAFALVRQFFRLQENRVPTPLEISNLLNSTGKQINDTNGNGLNFSRIDIYSAIDSIIKTVSVILTPVNNTFVNLENQNQTFVCNSSSQNYDLTNVSFYLWNSTGDLRYNLTENINGIINSTNFYYNFSIEDNYTWNCIAYNNQSFLNTNGNYSLTYDATSPNVTLISPEDSASYSSDFQSITFDYNISDVSISNCSLLIDDVVSLVDSSITNLSLTQSFTQIFSPGIYEWEINCTDSADNKANSSQRSFTVTALPVVDNSGSSSSSSGGSSNINTITTNNSIDDLEEEEGESPITGEVVEYEKETIVSGEVEKGITGRVMNLFVENKGVFAKILITVILIIGIVFVMVKLRKGK